MTEPDYAKIQEEYEELLSGVEDKYLVSDRFMENFMNWKKDDPTATREDYIKSARYEYDIESYANDLYPPENYDF